MFCSGHSILVYTLPSSSRSPGLRSLFRLKSQLLRLSLYLRTLGLTTTTRKGNINRKISLPDSFRSGYMSSIFLFIPLPCQRETQGSKEYDSCFVPCLSGFVTYWLPSMLWDKTVVALNPLFNGLSLVNHTLKIASLTMRLAKEMYKESGINDAFPTTLRLIKLHLPTFTEYPLSD